MNRLRMAVCLSITGLAGCERTSPEPPSGPAPAADAPSPAVPPLPPLDSPSELEAKRGATEPSTQPAGEVVEERFPDGKLKLRKQVIRDAEGKSIDDGLYTSWWENGNKRAEGQMVSGKQHGTWHYWHESGDKKSEEPWVHGALTGVGIYWHPDGLKTQKAWTQNIADGAYTVWHPNGQMAELGSFVDGKPDGKFQYWDEQGRLIREVIYVNGEMVSEVDHPVEDAAATQPG